MRSICLVKRAAFGVFIVSLVSSGPQLIAQTKQPADKIPITTSSDEARTLYVQGRDLAEKLRATDARKFYEQAVAKDPNFALAYLMRARVSRLTNEQAALAGAMIPYYEKFVELTEAKGPVSAADKTSMIESYNNLGAFYATTDKVKAKAYLEKTLALDPANVYATGALQSLNASPATPAANPK